MSEVLQYGPEGTPFLELSAQEWAFPLAIEQNGQEYVAGFHMTAYQPRELDEILRQLAPVGKRDKSWVRLETLPLKPVSEFIDRHFLRITGIAGEPSAEVQRAYLDRKLSLKRATFMLGFGGVRRFAPSANGHSKFVLNLDEANQIKTEVPLWSTEHEKAEMVSVTHLLRDETRDDFERYGRAARRTDVSTRGEARVSTDYMALGSLYDAMIQCIVGAWW